MPTETSTRIESIGTADAQRPIDLDFLAGQTLGDAGLESEVLRLFDEIVHVYLDRLETSTTVTDLISNLHTIRGAAAGIGAFPLAGLAKAAETALRAGHPVNPRRIEEVGVAIETLSLAIAERLRDAAA
jgi:HPt (histidine-containing phosphotransfer) domain-containing protein